MVNIMDSAGKQSSHDLQICEHGLRKTEQRNKKYLSLVEPGNNLASGSPAEFLLVVVNKVIRGQLAELTSKAGVDRRTWVDCTTSAACMLL